MKLLANKRFLAGCLQSIGRSICKRFRLKRKKKVNALAVTKVFKTRHFCSLAVVNRLQPNAVATFRAIPLYLSPLTFEVWVWCDSLRSSSNTKQRLSHLLCVAKVPRGAALEAIDFWEARCQYLWCSELNLIDPLTQQDYSYLTTQIVATQLIWYRHDEINWDAVVKKAVNVAQEHTQNN